MLTQLRYQLSAIKRGLDWAGADESEDRFLPAFLYARQVRLWHLREGIEQL